MPAELRPEMQSAINELIAGIECVPPPEQADSCRALEDREKQLEEKKKALAETIEDEDERKAREAQIEQQKKAVEEALKTCREREKDH